MKYYKTVSVEDELPEVPGPYYTDIGLCTYDTGDNWVVRKDIYRSEIIKVYPDWWFKEIELPTEEEIEEIIDRFSQPLDITGINEIEIDQMEEEYDIWKAKFSKAILNLLKQK